MIFLIDDKKKRQEDFGWTESKFNQYENIIQQIYSLEDLKSKSKDIFQKGNIVLYHESFLDNTSIKKEAAIKRSQLEEYANENSDFYLAIFSGSKSSRSMSENIAHLPVAIVFQNLGILTHKALEGFINLKYLLFGENPEIEEELSLKLDIANKEIDSEPAKIAQTKNLFLRPTKGDIQNAIENADVEILYNDVSDEKLSEKLKDWLIDKEFDNIFIPICFGPVLSDFNGLRLATHIRCTESPNQLKNIFIYSFVGIEYLYNNEYFNILKTKNVYLVKYKKSAFTEAIQRDLTPLTLDNLPKEVNKIKLEPPRNYEDSHSIANEWAIMRWAKALGIADAEIEKIKHKTNNNLYFKYLSTIYSNSNLIPIDDDELTFENKGKVLYIDDEAEKGWYELLCNILYDINKIDFERLGDEFLGCAQIEIIDICTKKIKSFDPDVVILDLRLHGEDFDTNLPSKMTGFKILQIIKEVINPGIRVIIFTASNKVWNLIELQNAGADGFILKESPELGLNKNYTTETVLKFSKTVNEQLGYQFQKDLFAKCREIKRILILQKDVDNKNYNQFVKTLIKQINIIYSSIRLINLNKLITMDIVFLSCYNFLELFGKYYLFYDKSDYRYYLGVEVIDLNRFEYIENRINCTGPFIANNKYDSPSWFITQAALIIDYFKTSEPPNYAEVMSLRRIADMRNNYIHSNKKSFIVEDVKLIMEALENACKKIKE